MRRLVLAFALIAASASGQTPAAPAVDPAHAATPEQIREYFALTHLGDSMKTLMSQMIHAMKVSGAPYIPDSFWADMDSSMRAYDFLSEMIPIYQKHLTREDMAGVLTFYASEPGQHLLANQTAMTTEAQAAFRAIGERIGEQVGERHSDEIMAARKKYEENIANKQNLNLNPDPK
jgi:hypothetical protein